MYPSRAYDYYQGTRYCPQGSYSKTTAYGIVANMEKSEFPVSPVKNKKTLM